MSTSPRIRGIALLAIIASLFAAGLVAWDRLASDSSAEALSEVDARETRCVLEAHGKTSDGCQELIRLLARTCLERGDSCRFVIKKALKTIPFGKDRDFAAKKIAQGLAAAGLRGSIIDPDVLSGRSERSGEARQRARERIRTQVERTAPRRPGTTPKAPRPSRPGGGTPARVPDSTPNGPPVSTPADPPSGVDPPALGDPSPVTPATPDVSPVTVPEVPVEPAPVVSVPEIPVEAPKPPKPKPGHGNGLPLCDVVPVRPCRPPHSAD